MPVNELNRSELAKLEDKKKIDYQNFVTVHLVMTDALPGWHDGLRNVIISIRKIWDY